MRKKYGGSSLDDRISIHDGKRVATAIKQQDGSIEVLIMDTNSWKKERCRWQLDYIMRVFPEKAKTKDKKSIFSNKVFSTILLIIAVIVRNVMLVAISVYGKDSPVSYLYLLPLVYLVYKECKMFYPTRNLYNDELRKNHAAEHMVCNACDKMQYVPPFEIVKRFSKYSGHCGRNNPNIRLITGFVLGFILFKLTGILIHDFSICLMAEHLGYLFPLNIGGLIAQRQVLLEPDEENLLLAYIAAHSLEEFNREHPEETKKSNKKEKKKHGVV